MITVKEAIEKDCPFIKGKCSARNCMMWYVGYDDAHGDCSIREVVLNMKR